MTSPIETTEEKRGMSNAMPKRKTREGREEGEGGRKKKKRRECLRRWMVTGDLGAPGERERERERE